MDIKSEFKQFRANFDLLLKDSKTILLSSHLNPDDDSIGSILSLYSYLSSNYPDKKIKMAYSSPKIDRWSYFANFELIEFGTDIVDMISEYDLLIALDTSVYNRLSYKEEVLRGSSCKKICIDHHSNVPSFFDLILVTEQQSSVSQMIYTLFYQDDPKKIDLRTAETLLLGILGDTNWFLVNMKLTNLEIFDVVKRIVGDGQIDLETFGSKYKGYSSRIFQVIQECVKNARIVEVAGWPKFIYTFIPRSLLVEGKFSELELREGSHIYTASYNKTLRDVPWGATLYPAMSGEVNCSLRSRPGSVNVSVFGKQMGMEGGGHPGSGGLTFKREGELLETEACAETFIAWLKEHEPTPYTH
jgi:bifunctional oligoribonuclease and PAP phosphatase NrnA